MRRREWVEDGVICEEVTMTAEELAEATARPAPRLPGVTIWRTPKERT